jgi:hypothetical protein
MAISGGSAGGYTTLACLAFKDVFKAVPPPLPLPLAPRPCPDAQFINI